MTKTVLNDLANLENQTSAVNIINANNAVIETAFDNTLSRDGTSPNRMESALDMNSERILNLPTPSNNLEPVRVEDLNSLLSQVTSVGNVPAGGLTNQVLTKRSTIDYDVDWTGTLTARTKLSGDTTWYVRTDGSDLNDGLTDTSSGAFLTIQHAINVVLLNVDCNGFIPTIQVRDGTFGPAKFFCPAVGCHEFGIFLQGNSTTPANCLLTSSNGPALTIENGANVRAGGFKVTTTGSGTDGIFVLTGGVFNSTFVGSFEFGNCVNSHWAVGPGGTIFSTVNYTITGGGTSHWHAGADCACIVNGSQTITITGSVTFSAYFCGTNKGSVVCGGVTFVGNSSGPRFVSHVNGTIDVGNHDRYFLPGDIQGAIDNGGIYAGSLSLDGALYDPEQAWAPYTPTISSGTGTFTSASATGRYKIIGTTFILNISIVGTTLGTAASWIVATIPNIINPLRTAVSNTALFGINTSTGKAVSGVIGTGGNSIVVRSYDGTFPFPSDGQTLYLTGIFETVPF